MTLKPSHQETPTTGGLTASSGVSPARISATPASGLGSTVSAPACGPNTRGSLAFYDPDSSSWRTWQRCLIEGLTEFSGTWPRAGMTRNGIVYRRRSLVPHSFAIGFFWLPTLTANVGERGGKGDLLGLFRGYVYRGSHGSPLMKQTGSRARATGQLNPDWCDWYAGFPPRWTDLEDSETR
jgi:hypothetical protein